MRVDQHRWDPVPLVMPVVRRAVTVALPAVFKVTLNVWVPLLNVALTGSEALLSELVIPTVSLMELTRFQFASTALTVTAKEAPAV